jgi:hypothetical protein
MIRWEMCSNNFYQVHYIKECSNLLQSIDLAIVSSTANARVEIIKKL